MAEIKKKKKHNYVFPNILSKAMSKVDMRTQMEASMLSMSFILVGMLISIGYVVIVFDFPLWYRITLIINGLAGIVFLSSFLVTTFQQYQSYLSAVEFQSEIMKGGNE